MGIEQCSSYAREAIRVLVTSGDSVYAKYLEERLEHEGMGVVRWSADAPPNLRDLAGVDVVLVETHELGDAGWMLLEMVREQAPLTEIVVISSEPPVESAVQAFRSGVFAILPYPVSDVQLINAITSACRRKRHGEERMRNLP